ncbi:hypothetical protein RSD66_07670 [Brevundimonas sp. S1H14]|uniref:hypothetical protein n=1 Tax=Brevundimonas sp. S1H14 TaxID=3078084 RepID=UPI0039EB6F82
MTQFNNMPCLGAAAVTALLVLALPGIGAAQTPEGLVERHHRVCVLSAAQPEVVRSLLADEEEWRPMFAASESRDDLVSRVSVTDPMDVIMAQTVNTRGVVESICSVQRRGGDFDLLKAEFEASTTLEPVARYSSRTVAVYIARVIDGHLASVEQPDLDRARRNRSFRIFSLSRMGSDALIVVSAPQGERPR